MKRARRSDDSSSIAVNAGLLNGSSSSGVIISLSSRSSGRSDPAIAANSGRVLAVLIAVELIEERVGAADRLPSDLETEWPQDRPQSFGQLVDRDDTVFRVDIQPFEREDRCRSCRQTHECTEDFWVGFLGGQFTVSITVEAGVKHPDRVDPGRLERPALGRNPQAYEDGSVIREEDQVARSITPRFGRRVFLGGRRGQSEEDESRCSRSSQNSLDEIGLRIDEPDRPAVALDVLLGRVDPQGLDDGRE